MRNKIKMFSASICVGVASSSATTLLVGAYPQ